MKQTSRVTYISNIIKKITFVNYLFLGNLFLEEIRGDNSGNRFNVSDDNLAGRLSIQ